MPRYHYGYAPDPPSFCISLPPSISSMPQARVGPPIRTLVQGIVLFLCSSSSFSFHPPFRILFLEVEHLKHRPEVKCTLMQLSLHCPGSQCCLPGCCSPSRPCCGLCVPKCDTAKTPKALPSLLPTTPPPPPRYVPGLGPRRITLPQSPPGSSASSFILGPGSIRRCYRHCGFHLNVLLP